MDHVGNVAAVEAQQELRVEVVVADLLEVDLDVDARVLLLEGGSRLLDVFRLEARLVRICHVDRPGDGAAAGPTGGPARTGGRRATADGRGAAGDHDTRRDGDLQEAPTRHHLTNDLVHMNLLHVLRASGRSSLGWAIGQTVTAVPVARAGAVHTAIVQTSWSQSIGASVAARATRKATAVSPFWRGAGRASESDA